MFGYVTIYKPELKVKDFYRYKAFYCGLCRSLKERYGGIGQMTLTYDMTFAILLLTSLYESETKQQERHCMVHPVRKVSMLQNEITDYAADMNVILAYYHFVDDWKDEKSIAGLTGSHLLHGKIEGIVRKYPRQCHAIRKGLKELRDCENRNVQQADLPAGCFGRMMEELLVYRRDVWEPGLRRLGFFLGKFIYLMDAYEDLPKDRKNNCYNPLISMREKDSYEADCANMLTLMMAECSNEFEKLPCLQDKEILDNILYAGVWNRYNKIQEKRNEGKEQNNGK